MEEKKLKQSNILFLTIKKKWYDAIYNGTKTTEYRELKGYWCKRIKGLGLVCPYPLPDGNGGQICQRTGKECLSGRQITQDRVKFRCGDDEMTLMIKTLSIQEGKPQWGAPEGEKVINIGLGEKV